MKHVKYTIATILAVAVAGGCQVIVGIESRSVGEAAGEIDGSLPDADADVGVDADSGKEAGSSYVTEVLADSPVGYWRLGESKPATAAKSEVRGLTCTFVGTPTLGANGAIAGDSDTAYRLDGTTALDCGKIFDFIGTQPYSLEIWIQTDLIDANYRFLFRKEGTYPPATRESYGVSVHAGDGLKFERWVSGTSAYASSSTFAAGPAFHHVVSVYTGSGLVLFIDGVIAGTATDTRAAAAKDNPFDVGMGGNFFVGTIDEVAVYDKALSQARILSHYHAAGR